MVITACGNNNSTNKQTNEKEKYQCPMKCEGEKTYDKPGQCPVCKMDLEKVEGHKTQEEDTHNH